MPQNNSLLDLANTLIAEGYTNVFLDTLPEIPQRTVIMSEPSPAGFVGRQQDATIYVRDPSPTTASDRAVAIASFLHRYQGKLTGEDTTRFVNIQVTNTPRFWGYNENTKATEFALSITCLIQDNNYNRIA